MTDKARSLGLHPEWYTQACAVAPQIDLIFTCTKVRQQLRLQ